MVKFSKIKTLIVGCRVEAIERIDGIIDKGDCGLVVHVLSPT